MHRHLSAAALLLVLQVVPTAQHTGSAMEFTGLGVCNVEKNMTCAPVANENWLCLGGKGLSGSNAFLVLVDLEPTTYEFRDMLLKIYRECGSIGTDCKEYAGYMYCLNSFKNGSLSFSAKPVDVVAPEATTQTSDNGGIKIGRG